MKKKIISSLFILGLSVDSYAVMGVGDVVYDPTTAANIIKQIDEYKKQYKLLTDTLDFEMGDRVSADIGVTRGQMGDFTRKKLGGGDLADTAGDMVEDCFGDLTKGLGFDLPKLPDISFCGVNITKKITDTIFTDVTDTIKDDAAKDSVVEIKEPVVTISKDEMKEITADINDKILKPITSNKGGRGGGGVKRSDVIKKGSGLAGGGSSDVGPINTGPSTDIAELYKNTKSTSDLLSGTDETPEQKAFANKLFNQAFLQELLHEVNDKQIRLFSKRGTNIFDQEIQKNIKENKNKEGSVLDDIPMIVPELSSIKSEMSGKKLLSSRDDKKLYNTNFHFTSAKKLTDNKTSKGDFNKLSEFTREYKKATKSKSRADKYSSLDSSVYNYAKMSEFGLKSALVSIASIKADTEDGKFLVNLEMQKAILYQMFVLNSQIYTNARTRENIEYIKYQETYPKLDSMEKALQLLLNQNTEQFKTMLKRQ
jgi:hypothetical protein